MTRSEFHVLLSSSPRLIASVVLILLSVAHVKATGRHVDRHLCQEELEGLFYGCEDLCRWCGDFGCDGKCHNMSLVLSLDLISTSLLVGQQRRHCRPSNIHTTRSPS